MKRLECVLSYINGYALADIGCDHGYLAIDAVKKNNVKKAYCMDINEMPLKKAYENITKNNLNNQVKTILSDGLTNLPDDADIVSICGMGGILIKDILENGKEKLKNVKYLVLEANNNQNILRKYLNNSNFLITNETMCLEKGHIYEIIIIERGKMNLTKEEIDFGPFILKNKCELFKIKYKNILKNLEESFKKATNEKSKLELREKIDYINKNLGE